MEQHNTSQSKDQLSSLINVGIFEKERELIGTIAQWAKIGAITGLITIFISLITTLNNYEATISKGPLGSITFLINMVSFVMYILIFIFQWNIAVKMRRAIDDEDQDSFNGASLALRNYFISIVSFMILLVVASIISGVVLASIATSPF